MTLPGLEANSEDFKPLLLLSLQPKYWQLILEGKKKYEYRRSFRLEAVRAYIYVSSPRQEVAGFIDFGVPIIGAPNEIAEIAERQASGSRQDILDYLKGKDVGYAIPILLFEEMTPVSLAELRSRFDFAPPQSYQVLDNNPELRDFIRARHLEGVHQT